MMSRAIVIVFLVAASMGAAVAAPLDSTATVTHDEAKPTGPISVDVRLAALPALGVPLTVIVTARADAIERLELEARSDDPAALVITAESAPVDRAGVRTWSVTVVPARAPGGNLAVVVSGEIDGVAQARSVVTPIRLAGAAQAVRALSAAPVERDSENLSLLPVEERPQPPK